MNFERIFGSIVVKWYSVVVELDFGNILETTECFLETFWKQFLGNNLETKIWKHSGFSTGYI